MPFLLVCFSLLSFAVIFTSAFNHISNLRVSNLRNRFHTKNICTNAIKFPILKMSNSFNSESEMTLDEIKAELDFRKVDYEDCISRGELVSRLIEVRATGRADPDIISKFNNDFKDQDLRPEDFESELVNEVVAKDGSLPGGIYIFLIN